jgi:hypothetical protein
MAIAITNTWTESCKLKCHLFLNNSVHETLDLILNLIRDAIKITSKQIIQTGHGT